MVRFRLMRVSGLAPVLCVLILSCWGVSARTGTPSVVTFCADPDWLPYEAIHSGKHTGIAADYLAVIGQLANVEFKLVETTSWDASLQGVKEGRCDAISMLNTSHSRRSYLDFTRSYFQSANVFVSIKKGHYLESYEQVTGQRVGVVKGYRLAEYIERYYPDVSLTYVDSEMAGLEQLASGEIDLFVGSMLSVTHQMNELGLPSLRIAGLAKPHDALAIGVRKGQSALLEKLDRAVELIPEATHVDILRTWNTTRVIGDPNHGLIMAIASGFAVVMFLVLMRHRYIARYNRSLKAKNQMLEALQDELLEKNATLEFLSTHDQLTATHNRHFMIKRCEEEILRMGRFQEHSCLILLDIDLFKQVNDTYGHSTGDQILKELTALLSDHIREIDVLARWGGEEFLILCPHTDMREANALSVRLGQAIAGYEFSKVGDLTCSFGIAQYIDGESFVKWFDRVDQALYEAKEMGRNRIVIAR